MNLSFISDLKYKILNVDYSVGFNGMKNMYIRYVLIIVNLKHLSFFWKKLLCDNMRLKVT